MKILEITEFSAGICGVWNRVLSESEELVKLKHEVIVFSSDLKKGSEEIAQPEEIINKVKIRRFPHKTGFIDKFITKNVTFFDFKEEFINLKPDLVITHLIHPHSFKALKLCKKMRIPCYLVPHAPFNTKRGFILTLVKTVYDILNRTNSKIRRFDKVIAISEWEIPILKKIGVKNIFLLPNGIPDKFFKVKRKEGSYILYLGRISPVKNLEILNDLDYEVKIVGPIEKGYNIKLKHKINSPVYDLDKKIDILNNCKVFILPSKREGMPQSIIEAMALGKIVIGSDVDGITSIVKDGKNGFIFHNVNELKEKVDISMKGDLKQIRKNAIETAEKYKWSKIVKEMKNVYSLG